VISLYSEGVGEVVAKLDALDGRMTEELRGGVQRLTIKLQKKVKEEKLSGQVLGVRTGRLKRSIQQDVQVQGTKISGVVSTNVFYGVGWELGWPDGKGSKGLSSAKAKFKPSAGARQRPFLVPSLKEMEQSGIIAAELDAALVRGVQ
jgi:hypothetical protein